MWRRRRIAIVVAAVLAGAGLLTGAQALGLDGPDSVAAVMESSLPNDTLLYDRTGTVLLADIQQPGGRHTDVTLQAMGRWLPEATVAVDDPGFWSEPGVDPGRLAGAALGSGGTASSITVRLVRLRLGAPAGVVARARAVALAVRIAATYPREQILDHYLNSLFYGNGSVGAEAAATTYFQVDAGQLDLAQAALIAGLPQAPAALDPLRHLDAALARQRQVLDAMVRSGAIQRADADRAAAEPLRVFGPTNAPVAASFVDLVQTTLRERYGAAILRGGVTAWTTLDWGLQQQAELAVAQALDPAGGETDASLAAIDPRTGDVLAYAQADQVTRGYDNGVLRVNPGSAFRVFTYAAAIASRRYTMVTPLADEPLSVSMPASGSRVPYTVEDFDLRSHGVCALRDCLGNGFNVPAVEMELGLGVAPVVEMARALGAPPLQIEVPGGSSNATAAPDSFGLSLTLGGYAETPLAMTAGLATLADGGTARAPNPLLEVTPARGRPLTLPRSEPAPVLDPGAAFIVSETLADAASRALAPGPAAPLAFSGRRVAAVTGTAELNYDTLVGGYTPSIAATVWAGRLYVPPGTLWPDGSVVAASAWHRFMQAALDQLGRGDEWYQPPAGVTPATVDGRPAWFLTGTSPATPAPALPPTAQVLGR
jgi:membrane peptidoglycan carboxypeptidase